MSLFSMLYVQMRFTIHIKVKIGRQCVKAPYGNCYKSFSHLWPYPHPPWVHFGHHKLLIKKNLLPFTLLPFCIFAASFGDRFIVMFFKVTIVKSALMVGMATLLMPRPRTAAPVHALGDHMLSISLPEPASFQVMVCQPVLTALRVTRGDTAKNAWMATLGGQGWVLEH